MHNSTPKYVVLTVPMLLLHVKKSIFSIAEQDTEVKPPHYCAWTSEKMKYIVYIVFQCFL